MAKPKARLPVLPTHLPTLLELPDPALRALWSQVFDQPPPPGSRREFLIGGLAYRVQEEASGGLSRHAVRTLRELAKDLIRGIQPSNLATITLKPGTRLLRTWQRETHEVLVLDKGFLHRDETYRSLSEIARKITGARWSGPLFFGLKGYKPKKPTTQTEGN